MRDFEKFFFDMKGELEISLIERISSEINNIVEHIKTLNNNVK